MHPQAGDAKLPDRGAGRTGSGLGSRRIMWISFGISLFVHVLLIGLYPVYGPAPDRQEPDAPRPDLTPTPDGLEVLRLLETAQVPDAERPDDPEEIEEIDEPTAAPVPFIIETDAGVTLTPPPLTGAELLRPRLRDERLWRPVDPSLTELSLEQREELALAGSIEEWYDSLAAAGALESALTDWTFTDSEGKRWGVSEGKLHLGDITLPLPFAFGTPIGKREEVAERMWQWDEIMRQSARFDVDEARRERQEAIRERRDRERNAETRPDTTRSRR